MSGVTLPASEGVAGENCLDIVGVILYILTSSISDSWSSAYRVVCLKVLATTQSKVLLFVSLADGS